MLIIFILLGGKIAVLFEFPLSASEESLRDRVNSESEEEFFIN